MNDVIGITEFNKDFAFIKWLVNLDSIIKNMDKRSVMQFVTSCCERQFGNYSRFHDETGWGSPSVLCRGLNALWAYPDINRGFEIDEIRRSIESITPNPENFSSPYTSAALDAGNSLLECFDFWIDDDLAHCINIACYCRDSIYMFIQQRDDLDYSDASDKAIYDAPLMCRELSNQKMDIAVLLENGDAGSRLILSVESCDPRRGSLVG